MSVRIVPIALLGALLAAIGCSAPVDEPAAAPPTSAPVAQSPATTTPAPAHLSPSPTEAIPPTSEQNYRIGPGDRLEISVYKQPELSGIFNVLPEGIIRYPLVGSIRMADLSIKEASERIESALEEKYLVDAQVNLVVKEFLSKPINVLGSVRNPGKYYLKAKTTLMDILTEAGGLSGNSGDAVIISRRISDPKTGGAFTKTYTLNLDELMKGKKPELDIVLAEGDTVNVAERTLFYVSGEVAKPGGYRVESGMTLLKAISAAGGLGKFATKRGVEVHRKVGGEEQVLKYNLGKIEDQEEPDPPILAEDVVIVARRFF